MKKNRIIVYVTMLAIVFMAGSGFNSLKRFQQDALAGAWHLQNGTTEMTWIFVDGYSTISVYDKVNKRFILTSGGPYQVKGNVLMIQTEFNTTDSGKVGQALNITFSTGKDELIIQAPEGKQTWKRADNGSGALAGNWRITGRMQDGRIVESRPGPRKTLKLLSGTRFQWVAINPGVKGFYGTGGGTYTFANGKYTENIEFFSRDSTRVGASLSFDGKVENDAWHHSGLNSRGEPLNEIWKRVKNN